MNSYEINPRPPELGGGWRLRFLEDGVEVGGGVFPIEDEEPRQGVDWWNRLQERERAHWLAVAGAAVPVDAWIAYLRSEAYLDAQAEASEWLATRECE